MSTDQAQTENREIQTVSELTLQIKRHLESAFTSVWVSGEISNLSRPQSGHIYFSLKDDSSQLRAVLWRSTARRIDFDLEDGQEVICGGDIDLYPPRGSYQIVVRKIEPVGAGELQRAFRRLYKKLQAEGLFEAEHKKPIPRFPRRLAVITSPTGAAIRDFCQVAKRRWPQLKILIVPCRVQGDQAPGEIVEALKIVDQMKPAPDLALVTRGGGSVEDLWAFNDENVVRAVFNCQTPTVSAIGHEIDVSLTDLAADQRALTPSEAAEMIVPQVSESLAKLQETKTRLATLLHHQAKMARQRVDALALHSIFRRPLDYIREFHRQVDSLDDRARLAMERIRERKAHRLANQAARLESMNPLAVLARGYSVTTDKDRRILTDPAQVEIGSEIRTRLHWGEVASHVSSVQITDEDPDTA